jgi:hypothetical protein
MPLLETLALFATALLFGAMAFFAAGVAPIVFRVLDAEAGGRFVRALFPNYYLWLLATSAAAGVALIPLRAEDAGMMAIVAGLTFWLRQSLMPRINALSDAAKAGDAAAKREFDRAHRLSVVLNLLQMLVAAVVLARFAA